LGRRDSLGADLEVNLVPFYRLHRRAYAVYFDLFSKPEWEKKKAEYVAEQERQCELEKGHHGLHSGLPSSNS